MDDIVDIADLDVIYLSYDEPAKEEFWLKIKNMVPWAKRVDGVKGMDKRHKKDFLDVFPEFTAFYEKCKQAKDTIVLEEARHLK